MKILAKGREGSSTEAKFLCIIRIKVVFSNGTPLQCSCLENPRDRGAWWAAVSGVAQSQTRLKQLSRGKEPRTSQTTWQSDHPKLFCLLSPRHAPIPQAALSRLQPETAPFPPCSGLCRARQRKKKKIITTGLVTLSWSHTSAEGEETSPPFKF